tara:strand:- start:2645 stop:3433 length:789 start_codon:yes stop_codon:yes gene_type:complete
MSVTTPYTYVDELALSTDQHNRNVYSTNAGEGIYSEINGGVDSFSSSFKVQEEHVRPEQATRARQEFAVESLDFFTDAMSENDGDKYRPIAGCSARVHVPYDASLSLWQWSAFIHPYKVRGVITGFDQNDDPTGYTSRTSDVFIRASLNGTALHHTKRTIPTSSIFQTTKTTSGDSSGRVDSFERRACLQFDMSHLQQDVTAGWHDLTLTIYMEPLVNTDGSLFVQRYYGGLFSDDASNLVDHVIYHRVSFGIRSARVLTLL